LEIVLIQQAKRKTFRQIVCSWALKSARWVENNTEITTIRHK